MVVFISLFLLFLAGLALSGIPPQFFKLETSLSSGKLYVWMTLIRAYAIPLSLLILKLTKNHYIKLACAFWGTFLSLFTLIILFRISAMAPSVNLYGALFIVGVFICCLSVATFSWIELSQILKEALERSEKQKKSVSTASLSEVEGTYQTPTNPS